MGLNDIIWDITTNRKKDIRVCSKNGNKPNLLLIFIPKRLNHEIEASRLRGNTSWDDNLSYPTYPTPLVLEQQA